MQRLRASLDNGNELSNDEERRLVLWEETGQPDVDEDELIRESQALMLFSGTSKFAAATMRNQKAQMLIEKI